MFLRTDEPDQFTLKCYVVIAQDVSANTELVLDYYKFSNGEESLYSIEHQSVDKITLRVKLLPDEVIKAMPEY